MQTGDGSRPARAPRVRRRDRHGRGLRGVLAPPGVPLHRTRSERFDDLVLQAVARLEPRWEAELAGVEFAIEEIPPALPPSGTAAGPVPLARLEPGGPGTSPPAQPGAARRPPAGQPAGPQPPGPGTGPAVRPGDGRLPAPDGGAAPASGGGGARPPRIVIYRRPLLARAEGEDDLGELVFDVVVEEFAHLLGVDPEDVDPGYAAGD